MKKPAPLLVHQPAKLLTPQPAKLLVPRPAKLRVSRSTYRNSGYERVKDEHYVEPKSAVRSILDAEYFDGAVFDPACGYGTIPSVCMERGIEVTYSDLIDRGFGPVRDFFTCNGEVDNIICNPPYKIAFPFLEHALPLTRGKVAFFLPLSFLESQHRNSFFQRTPPVCVWVFSQRISAPPGKTDGTRDKWGALNQPEGSGSKTPYCWGIWMNGYEGETALRWLPMTYLPSKSKPKSEPKPKPTKRAR